MAKKFLYHGKSTEELIAMPMDQFILMMPSNLRRTMKRASPKIKAFLLRIRKAKAANKVVKTHLREMPILPEMVGMRFKVYNGKEFQDVPIMTEMLGRRLGEYVHTTKMVKHSGPGIGATRGSKSVDLK
ncbi:MAG: 30S ribosomal protein S19 [Candidatus Micrarchaeia archaeon]